MRLFVAIAPPPAVLDELDALVEPLRARRLDLRWTNREAWHVTLAFLGQVDEDRGSQAAAAAPAGRRAASPGAARLRGRGCLPRRHPGQRAVEWPVRGPPGAGPAGRIRRGRRQPRGRAAAGQGPPVPAAPDPGQVPDARRRHRAGGRARRLPGPAVDRGPRAPGPQPAGRDRVPAVHLAGQLAAAHSAHHGANHGADHRANHGANHRASDGPASGGPVTTTG